MTNEKIAKVSNFLNEAKIFYLLTNANNAPKGRPFAFHMVENDTIYFATVTFKNVYKQLLENPNAEILACTGNKFLRYDGKAVIDTDKALSAKVMKMLPLLHELYGARPDFELAVFHLKHGNVEIRSMTETLEQFVLS